MKSEDLYQNDGADGGGDHSRRLKKQRQDIAKIFKKSQELLENRNAGDLDKLIDVGSILARTSNASTLLLTLEPQPYEVTFPLEFYEQIYRLNGWDTSGDKLRKRPGIVGTWTNWMIYIKYPEGTIKWLRKKNPSDGYGNRSYKYFQFLTPNGKSHLYEFIQSAIELMTKCHNWDQFKRHLAKGYNKTYQADMFDKDSIEWKPRD